jgi:hypothetical protein
MEDGGWRVRVQRPHQSHVAPRVVAQQREEAEQRPDGRSLRALLLQPVVLGVSVERVVVLRGERAALARQP